MLSYSYNNYVFNRGEFIVELILVSSYYLGWKDTIISFNF